MTENYQIIQGDCLEALKSFKDNSVDLIVTDPPYGAKFMGKDWDKAMPQIEVWQECIRILKPGAFAFVMSLPRSDLSWRMKANLEKAGFVISFTPIFWTFASGFPKAQNIAKAIEKRHREPDMVEEVEGCGGMTPEKGYNVTKHHEIYDKYTHPDAKKLAGAYGGFQPKPAVEEIVVAMKPLSEKSFIDQALANQKSITWLGDCKIPSKIEVGWKGAGSEYCGTPKGEARPQQNRFPANLLVSDDVLNDGKEYRTGDLDKDTGSPTTKEIYGKYSKRSLLTHGDSGSFSRYFDLDAWAANTLPFLIVPKPSKSEKNQGLEELPEGQTIGGAGTHEYADKFGAVKAVQHNIHPTVKPLKLMAYLIVMGSRRGDLVLDPFCGSGTTNVAAILLERKSIGIELEEDHVRTAQARCKWAQETFEANQQGLTMREKKEGQKPLFD